MNKNLLREAINYALFLESRLGVELKKHPAEAQKIKQLADRDPSSSLKYLAWQVKQLVHNEPIEEIISLTKQFHAKSNKLKQKNINAYKTLGDLRHALETELSAKTSSSQQAQVSKQDAERIYEDEHWFVVMPKTTNASCIYGRGSRWCISASQSENWFLGYVYNNTIFFFVIDKKKELHDASSKFAFAWLRNNDNEITGLDIFDAKDKRIYSKRGNTQHKQAFKLLSNEGIKISDAMYNKLNTKPQLKIVEEIKIARSTDNQNKILMLSKSSEPAIRYEIAINKNTPHQVLVDLSRDNDVQVRQSVARNNNTPLNILSILLKDNDTEVRNIARHTIKLSKLVEQYHNAYFSQGFAPSSRGGFEKIRQQPHQHPREIGFPYRNWDEDDSKDEEKNTVDDIEAASGIINKLNPNRVSQSTMSGPGDNYGKMRTLQQKQQARSSIHGGVGIEIEDEEEIDETTAQTYSIYSRQPGHHGGGLHQQPSKNGGAFMQGAAVAQPGQGPRGWASGVKDDDDYETDNEIDSPIKRFVKKSIKDTLEDHAFTPFYGREGDASTGRLGGFHSSNSWAKGVTQIKNKAKSDDDDKLKLKDFIYSDELEDRYDKKGN